jgi:predicted acyl esterase
VSMVYRVKKEHNVFVTMRDGVQLVANIYRPDAEGKFPALLSMSPYGKELQELPLAPQPLGISPLWDGVMEAGDTDYVVSKGYVHVIADLRGTGDSEGEYVGWHSKKEGEDGYDFVEWIAQQPWCNGNVGMMGFSYFGEVQLAVASEQPPHLRAIFPTGVWTDLYRRMTYHGGILCLFLYGLWDGRLGVSGFAPKKIVSAMKRNLSKDEFERRLEEALNNPDIRKFPNLYHLLKYPQKNPLFFDFLLNPYDGPFYWERSSYTKFDKIKIPVYSVGSWASLYDAFGQLSVYSEINAPKKLMMHPPGPPDRPWVRNSDVVVRWYDHWLKGIDTGIMDEPPIKNFVMGVNQWRYENEWPLARTEWVKFYLQSWERLSLEPETHNDEPDCFLQEPLFLSTKRQSLKYLSSPVPEDMEVIGPAAVYLFASIDTEDTNWKVELYDLSEYGSEQMLGRGFLKASHRALDESKSKPWQPYHPHTSSEPVVPGVIYEYAIELCPISNVFRAGHRIKLEIKSMESPKDPEMLTHFHPHLFSSKTTLHKIYRDNKYRSYVLLPITGKVCSL